MPQSVGLTDGRTGGRRLPRGRLVFKRLSLRLLLSWSVSTSTTSTTSPPPVVAGVRLLHLFIHECAAHNLQVFIRSSELAESRNRTTKMVVLEAAVSNKRANPATLTSKPSVRPSVRRMREPINSMRVMRTILSTICLSRIVGRSVAIQTAAAAIVVEHRPAGLSSDIGLAVSPSEISEGRMARQYTGARGGDLAGRRAKGHNWQEVASRAATGPSRPRSLHQWAHHWNYHR